MTARRRRHVILLAATAALLLALAGSGAKAYLDERRLRMVGAGMTVSEVEDLLGSPSYTERDPEILASPIHSCHSDVALVYRRKWRDSLFVHLDRREREVVCVERVFSYLFF